MLTPCNSFAQRVSHLCSTDVWKLLYSVLTTQIKAFVWTYLLLQMEPWFHSTHWWLNSANACQLFCAYSYGKASLRHGRLQSFHSTLAGHSLNYLSRGGYWGTEQRQQLDYGVGNRTGIVNGKWRNDCGVGGEYVFRPAFLLDVAGLTGLLLPIARGVSCFK